MYDIIIIGAGPAGLTAALYALRDGKKVLIFEKEAIGGKIASSPRVENYPGYQRIKGSELAEKLYQQVINLGGIIKIEEVKNIILDGTKKVITLKETYEGKSLILATGSHYRKLGLEKEEDFLGNGISFCTVCDALFYEGEDVCVVGGANSGIINALALSLICNKVYLIVRKNYLKGEQSQIKELEQKDNVEILYETEIQEIIGDGEVEAIKVLKNKELKVINVTGIFLSIGQDADIDYLDEKIGLSDRNYIKSDEDMSTNIPGVFVAGDVREKKVRQLTTAMSDGTIAALSAIDYIKNNY